MKDVFTKSAYITGTQINYYFICERKLWLFFHNIQLEKEHENVKLGKLLHEKSFKRDEKDVQLGPIAFDFVRRGDRLELHETKKSSKMGEAHEFQVLYYLYYLENQGIDAEAVIHFPEERKKERLELDDEKVEELEKVLDEIEEIRGREDMPDAEKDRVCRKCAYYEFCWV